jgi:nicotinate-nucleotide adenylyltransferase
MAAGGRRIALFGGTFDPIHSGHLAVVRAARRRFRLDRVYFIPCSRPPHKRAGEMLPFAHRFAMVALACAGEPHFVPSLAEADGNDGASGRIFYSVDTVRHFRREFSRPEDRLFFLLGADSFLQIATWKDYRTLLTLCDFIVAHRPGFRSDALMQAISLDLLAQPARRAKHSRSIALRHTTIHLLDAVSSRVSATGLRERLEHGHTIRGLVPHSVEDYITKQALYQR